MPSILGTNWHADVHAELSSATFVDCAGSPAPVSNGMRTVFTIELPKLRPAILDGSYTSRRVLLTHSRLLSVLQLRCRGQAQLG